MISRPSSPLVAVKIVNSRRKVSSKIRRFSGSSSTYRIGYSRRSRSISGLGCIAPLTRSQREAQRHGGARAGGGLDRKRAAVLFHDAPADREAEPRPAALG